jgi:hypothetical protein
MLARDGEVRRRNALALIAPFCNGPWFVNQFFDHPSLIFEHPYAGVSLLSGVGAAAAT